MLAPDISVVVPTFRRAGFLPGLVRMLEEQTLDPSRFEVIVVDNGSGDETQAVLAELAATTTLDLHVLEYVERQGPAGTRNAGWRSARAPFVAFTDDDCFPQPEWLEAGLGALRGDESIGVIQGRTDRPPDSALGEWSVWRKVDGETPFFEGCNLFFRRDALEGTGGFDEVAGFYFEDTAAGWAVVEAGWHRGYAPGALLYHPVEARGFRWHVRNGYVERNMVRIAARHPGFRRDACWKSWAFQRDTVLLNVAAVGLLLAFRRRAALALAVPYLAHCIRASGPHPRLGFLAERTIVDAARAAGHAVGSIENRTLVL